MVGAGAIGASAAYALARAGHEVVVLERGAIGMGASSGTACMVTASHAERMATRAMLLEGIRFLPDPAGPSNHRVFGKEPWVMLGMNSDAVEGDLGGHHSSVWREEQQFFASPTPSRLFAAALRNEPLSAARGGRECLDIHLELSGVVRHVRDPMTIRRKLPRAFIKLRVQDCERLGLSRQRKGPHRSNLVFRIALHVEQVTTVAGPVIRIRFALKQDLLGTGAAGSFPIQCAAAVERDKVTIRGPDRRKIETGLRCQTCTCGSGDLIRPDVCLRGDRHGWWPRARRSARGPHRCTKRVRR